MYDFSDSETMAEHLNDSQPQVDPTQEGTTLFRPSSNSRMESFENLLIGLLESSLENQKILQNLVEKITNQNSQNGEQVPLPQPNQ